ncbi:MAG: glycosyl transferase [Bacteroidales bacterium]|nr:glycosyl transferase [Bacteroidales bacterium]
MYKYKKVFGKYPNLKNPTTFNEKMQWKKLYDRRDIYTTISDKCAVREYVADRIGEQYLVPIFGVYNNVDSIPFGTLPITFVIKPTHSSNRVRIVRNINEENLYKIKKECKKWMKENYYYYGKEWQYKNINPQIIIEKMLIDSNGEIPLDYKFHCFNSKIEFIQVDIGRFKEHKRNFYNVEWEFMPVRLIYNNANAIEKPNKFNEMILLAEKLAKDFNYIRVDFYNINGKIFFGELTIEPESGFGQWYPKEYDEILGAMMKG